MTTIRRQRGLFYEDFHVGQAFEHHWGRTFTRHDGIQYASMTMQFNPMFFNRDYAESIGYADIPVPPLFVFTTALGMSVEDLSEAGGPFLGVDGLNFLLPVYPDDTVRSRSIVLSQRVTQSRPGWGIVEWRTSALNQRGETVLEFTRRNLSRLRPTNEETA